VQPVKHAFAPHRNGVQLTVCNAGQAPLPSHTAGLVIVPVLHDIERQEVSAAGILQVAFVPSQVPAHGALPVHAPWPTLGAPETNEHVPGTVPLQYSHVPLQAVLQQTVSAQLFVVQSLAAAHACPCFALHTPLASHVPVHRPLGSSMLFAATQV
jgi:hypothetical protein